MIRSLRITMMAMFLPLTVLSLLFIFAEWLFDREAPSGWLSELPWLFPSLASVILIGAALLSYRALNLKLQPLLRLQERRRDEDERWRSIMDVSADSVLLLDSNGRVRYANPSAIRMLGIDATDENALFIETSLMSTSRSRMKQELAIAMGSGYSSLTLEVVGQDGSVVIVDATLTLLVPPEFDDGRNVTVVMKDLSPQIRLAEEYKAAKEQAEESNRSKSGFLARISHEIRTPLHAVIGLSQLMNSPDLSKQQQEYLNQIMAISRNLVRTLNDLLDFSKLESDKLAMENVEFRVENTLEHLKHMMLALVGAKPISIRISKDGLIPEMLIGDPVRIEQVLYNLASNAIKFTDHGEIELEVRFEKGDDDEPYALYSVRDTGIGMTEQQMEQLFIPYQQMNPSLHRQYGGTGLGLVISKTLVELMGGHLTAKSSSGYGSEFQFRLPLLASAPPVADREQAWRDSPQEENRSDTLGYVLLIEDHEISRMIASKMLRSFHCEVYEAENANQAFELLQEIGSQVDLVLMDLHMPGIDGIAAVKTIRSFTEFREIPIVIQTADTTMEQHNRCLAAGANEVMTKPVEMNHLKQVLQRWIGEIPNSIGTPKITEPLPLPPIALEGLNVAEAIVRVDGRVPFYIAMLNRFQERYLDLVPTLRQSLEDEEMSGIRRVLHTFRGAASHLSAQDVYVAATRLEESLKNPGEDRMALLGEFESQLQIVFRSIDKYKKSISLTNISDTGGDLH